MKKIGFLLCLLFPICTITAQNDSLSKVIMEEVVVSATMSSNAIMNVPARIEKLTALEMQNIPALAVDEMLRFVAGITLNKPMGIFSARSQVSMRGSSSKEQGQVMVLLDGAIMNKSDGGGVNWKLINQDNVEVIEIVKGPNSALYGGNAMNGLISIITKKPAQKLEGSVSLLGGSYGTWGGTFTLSGKENFKNNSNFTWGMQARYRQSDGYIAENDSVLKYESYQQLGSTHFVKSYFKELLAGASFGYHLKNTHFIDFKINSCFDIRGGGETAYQQPYGNNTQYRDFLTSLTYQYIKEKMEAHVELFQFYDHYYKVNEYVKEANYTWYDVDALRQDAGAKAFVIMKLGKINRLTAGVDLRFGFVNASDIYYTSTDSVVNKGKTGQYALFIQEELSLFKDKVKIIGGLRGEFAHYFAGSFIHYDPSVSMEYLTRYSTAFGNTHYWAVSPKLAIQYKPWSHTRFYLSYGYGFKPPLLDELCRSGRVSGGFKIANPALKPDKLNNFELGGDVMIKGKLKFSFSAYYSSGKDYSYYVNTGEDIDLGSYTRPVFVCDNIGKVHIFGVEWAAHYKILKSLTTFANYTYTNAKIIEYNGMVANADLNGKYLTDIPDHIVNVGLIYHNPKIFHVAAYFNFVSSSWINDDNSDDATKYFYTYMSKYPAHYIIDLKIYREFFNCLTLSIDLQNITNQRYYGSKGSVSPGFMIFGEIKYRFHKK